MNSLCSGTRICSCAKPYRCPRWNSRLLQTQNGVNYTHVHVQNPIDPSLWPGFPSSTGNHAIGSQHDGYRAQSLQDSAGVYLPGSSAPIQEPIAHGGADFPQSPTSIGPDQPPVGYFGLTKAVDLSLGGKESHSFRSDATDSVFSPDAWVDSTRSSSVSHFTSEGQATWTVNTDRNTLDNAASSSRFLYHDITNMSQIFEEQQPGPSLYPDSALKPQDSVQEGFSDSMLGYDFEDLPTQASATTGSTYYSRPNSGYTMANGFLGYSSQYQQKQSAPPEPEDPPVLRLLSTIRPPRRRNTRGPAQQEGRGTRSPFIGTLPTKPRVNISDNLELYCAQLVPGLVSGDD
ncbi:hypothetical protein TWF506_004674 [Arthrobotrys conoides]|uniref:Uncharacterized protein n=1 Tax=Arthrobotrys conoides TaxID=74498 RepID=A0AAN8N2H3_9PEZI